MSDAVLLGIDLGGTSTKFGIGDGDGNVAHHWSMPTKHELGPDSVLDRIIRTIDTAIIERGLDQPTAIGIGVPGLVDLATGQAKFLPNFATQWRDVPVVERLTNHFRCEVAMLNDARAATLGELKFGRGKDIPNVTMAVLTIGTGIGGGVAIDGELRLGTTGGAGEIGHQTIVPDGPLCGCGNRGCLEALASGTAIVAMGARLISSKQAPWLASQVSSDQPLTPELIASAVQHDPGVEEGIRQIGTYLGIGVANVVTILHPDLVVIAGGVSRMGETLLEPIRREVKERVRMFPTSDLQVMNSSLGSAPGVQGALALAASSLQ
ncbi:MAG: ROK family protein [Planctomycetota bacterium]